jgi:hypothetical protein
MSAQSVPLRVHAVETIGVVGIVAYTGLVGWAATSASYDVWGALVVIPILVLGSVPLLNRAARTDRDERFAKLLYWAFALKLSSSFARWAMAFVLYGGTADAAEYHDQGERLAEHYRHGDFGADIGREFIGTGFVRVLTGAIYTITGPSIFVAYVVYAWLGFWGLYFLYRAFVLAVPDGDHARYAKLVLLLPSMLFWPSGLGKEALMTFGIGLAALGASTVLTGRTRGILLLVPGLVVTAVVRPHITAILFAGLAVAAVVRKSPRRATELTPLLRAVVIVGLVVAGAVVVAQAQQFLGIQGLSGDNVDAAITDTAARTAQGGSEFSGGGVNSPLDLPMALVSVLFRPFPFEAHNVQALIASAEGSVLFILVCRSWSRLKTLPQRLRTQPYLTMAVVYTLLFVYAFSNFSNFGILTRERVQVMPFALALICLPKFAADRSRARVHHRTSPTGVSL